MRTSRVSRETARFVSAQSPARRAATRRQPPNLVVSNASSDDDDANDAAGNSSHSEFSSPPSSPEREEDNTSTVAGSKRKRASANSRLNGNNISISARRSPRKALKADPDATSPLLEDHHRVRRQPAKRITGPNGTVTTEPPADWKRMYEMTAVMRKRVLAPVDTMGCESLAEEHRDPKSKRLQTLVALMLSSQTKDTVTAAAMKNLQANLPGGFTLQALLSVEPDDLNRLIEKVGFHNNKTKFIKKVAVILRDDFDGDIPDTIEGLVSLPGVGPKMAYLTMSSAWGRDEGIGVDVHVHRITNLWGWHKTSTPEQTRAELEAWLPRDLWHDINHKLVGFGQTICLPIGRRCGECDLATAKLCPSAVASSPRKKTVKRDVVVKTDPAIADDPIPPVIKAEVIKVETDDVGIKVEADIEDQGHLTMSSYKGE